MNQSGQSKRAVRDDHEHHGSVHGLRPGNGFQVCVGVTTAGVPAYSTGGSAPLGSPALRGVSRGRR